MFAVRRWLGALLLAFVLPSLLVPGGLDFSVCVCLGGSQGHCDSEIVDDCCVTPCCATRETPGPKLSSSARACAGCLAIQTQQRDDATPAKVTNDSPLPPLFALPIHGAVAFVEHASVSANAPRVAAHFVPPRLARDLPLRI